MKVGLVHVVGVTVQMPAKLKILSYERWTL